MLVAILNTCTEGSDDDNDDEEISNVSAPDDPNGTEIQTKIPDEEQEKRRQIIRNKIRAVGKVIFLYFSKFFFIFRIFFVFFEIFLSVKVTFFNFKFFENFSACFSKTWLFWENFFNLFNFYKVF